MKVLYLCTKKRCLLNEVNLQIHGGGVGLPLEPVLAGIFLLKLEKSIRSYSTTVREIIEMLC